MTKADLISYLEGFDDGQEIEVHYQENYPRKAELAGVTSEGELDDSRDDSRDDDGKIILVVGHDLGYGNRQAWEMV